MNKCLFSNLILFCTQLLLWLFLFFSTALVGCVKNNETASHIIIDGDESFEQSTDTGPSKRVVLELYAMSKCPYFQKLVLTIYPLIVALDEHIDLKIKYVGSFGDLGIKSMHGPEEVRGNILQLCAANHGNLRQHLDFMSCQYEDMRSIPSNWNACAQRAGIDSVILEGCYKGSEGERLVKDSVSMALKAEIARSPTILINGSKYEKGILRSSIAAAICDEFDGKKPEACGEFDKSSPVNVTVITDARCPNLECTPANAQQTIERVVTSPVIKHLDFSSARGRELFAKTGVRFLPVAVFDSTLEKDVETFANLERSMIAMDDDLHALPIGRRWEPTGEICDDGVDNTSDGLVDCKDPSCAAKLICRADEKRSLKLFTMSYCPYCLGALDFVKAIFKQLGNDADKIDFRVEFVGQEHDGDLFSSHGDKEIEENLRQICAQKYYSSNYKFMDYIWCRNREAGSARSFDGVKSSWRSCMPKGVDTGIIEKCAEGEEGKRLLLESFKLSKELGLSGSPVWVINNRHKVMASSVEEVMAAFCQENGDLEACDLNL